MLIVILLLSVMLLILSLLPVSHSQHYLVRSCDFVRLQVVYGALFCGVASVFYASVFGFSIGLCVAVALNIITIALQSVWIYPYTIFAPHEVAASTNEQQNRLRIMSANVLMSNRESDKLLNLVNTHQPDLFVTLESDSWWQQQMEPLHSDYPYRISCPKDNRYGMHIYSKFNIIDYKICELVASDVPSIHMLFETAEGVVMQGHFIHPEPPSPTEKDTSRPRDSELIMVAKAVKNPSRPVIVVGDLNDVAWSRSTRLFMQLSGFLDPRKGRGFFNTFHAGYFFMRWPLDHLFHSPGFTVASIKRLAKYGSDHFALLTELNYEQAQQESHLEQDLNTEEVAEKLQKDDVDKSQVPTFPEKTVKAASPK